MIKSFPQGIHLTKLQRLCLFLILAAVSWIPLSGNVNGESLSAVTLLYFRGTGQDEAVLLEWATATELSTVGFNIERSEQFGGPYSMLTDIGFVPSEGEIGGISGAEYQRVDRDGLVNGQTYWYILVEIEVDGNENRGDPISAVAGLAQPTAIPTTPAQPSLTPIAQSTSSSGNNNATVTASPQPTNSTTPPTTQATIVASVVSSDPRTDRTGSTNPQSAATTQAVNLAPGTESLGTGQSSAQAQATSVGESYPPPALQTPYPANGSAEGIGDAYVPPQQPTFDAYPEGYPTNVQNDFNPAIITSPQALPGIGQNASDTEQSDHDANLSEGSVAGTVVLWLGFAVGLIIFVACIIGSIYYFTRQRIEENR